MRKTIDALLERLLIMIIVVMLIAVIWQVISRYLLAAPSTLTDEIASFSLIWLGLFGAAYATGKELHLAIDLIPPRVVAKAPLWYAGIIAVAIFLFAFLVMAIGGTRLCWLTYTLNQRSAVLEVPLAFIYLAIPASGILICYYSLQGFFEKRNAINKDIDGLHAGADSST